ncbi:MAG: glycosyltransferase [Candidatus Thermoplasmatota archaeon]
MVSVSVILPVYNGEKYLEQCLSSIFDQTFKDYELIVINDGSTDDTKNILEKHKDMALIVHQENSGISKSLNKGLDLANGEYICFISHDDWWVPNKLEIELSNIKKSERIGVVYSDYYAVIGEKIYLIKSREHDPERLRKVSTYINCSSTMIRKKYLEEVKAAYGYYWDENLMSAMDGDLWIRLSKICHFKYIPIPLAYYRFHDAQTSKKLYHHKSVLQVYMKYNGFSLTYLFGHFMFEILKMPFDKMFRKRFTKKNKPVGEIHE